MEEREGVRGVVLRVPDVDGAARWLCEELFFSPYGAGGVRNGDCFLWLTRGESAAPPPCAPGSYHTGLAHIALAAREIGEALVHCRARGHSLRTLGGGSFFNPKVFGGGERYFNILTPFGAVIEVAQRVAAPLPCAGAPIRGLDHLGIPCADFDTELEELGAMGFAPLFAPVRNENKEDGRILCCMLSDGALTLEVYQFLDLRPQPLPGDAALLGVGPYPAAATHGGLQFIPKERLHETL